MTRSSTMNANLSDVEYIRAEREITLRLAKRHFLPINVSNMAVLREVYGYGSIPIGEYDNALAIVGRFGYSLAVIQ